MYIIRRHARTRRFAQKKMTRQLERCPLARNLRMLDALAQLEPYTRDDRVTALATRMCVARLEHGGPTHADRRLFLRLLDRLRYVMLRHYADMTAVLAYNHVLAVQLEFE